MFYIYLPKNAEPIYPFTLTDLRRLHTNVSWPDQIDDATAAKFGCYPVAPAQAPVAIGKKAVRTTPMQTDGAWVEQWMLVDYSAEEIEAQWQAVRADRNGRLAACDWTQLPDAPLTNTKTAEWAEYRQALRDVTTQSDPFNIVWPVKPS